MGLRGKRMDGLGLSKTCCVNFVKSRSWILTSALDERIQFSGIGDFGAVVVEAEDDTI